MSLSDMRLGDAAKKVGAGIGVAIMVAVLVLLWLGVPKMILEGRYCDDYVRAYNSNDTAEGLVAVQKLANLSQPNFFGIIDGRTSAVTLIAIGIVRHANAVAQAGTVTVEDAGALGGLLGDPADKCKA